MLTEPVTKATGSRFWSEFGLRETAPCCFVPEGFKFTEQVQVRLGADIDGAVAGFELRLARCLAEHPTLSGWGAQLLAGALQALRDPAYQPLAEELQQVTGPWGDRPDAIIEGFDSQLQVRRESDGSVTVVAELNDYQPCGGCGLFNPLSFKKCERCKGGLTRAKSIKVPELPPSERSGGRWWPFKKK